VAQVEVEVVVQVEVQAVVQVQAPVLDKYEKDIFMKHPYRHRFFKSLKFDNYDVPQDKVSIRIICLTLIIIIISFILTYIYIYG